MVIDDNDNDSYYCLTNPGRTEDSSVLSEVQINTQQYWPRRIRSCRTGG